MRTLVSVGVVTAALSLSAPANAVNPQLAGLQVALRSFGLYSGAVDGIAGPQTVTAVRVFQRRHGLAATGRADLRTRRALGPLGGPLFGRRPLVRGRFGWDVSVLQFVLMRRRFYNGALDGYFDTATERALRRYQRSVRLRADGVVGRRTFVAVALGGGVPVARSVTSSARRYHVRAGDTLTAIAARYGMSVATLARSNRLRPNGILPAGVWLRVPAAPAATASPIAVRETIDRVATRYGIDVHLVRALAWMESGYQEDVTSSAGARGVMQILPVTWEYVESVLLGRSVPRTTAGNIEIGVVYLRHLLREFRGNTRLALAAWYQGPASIRRHGVLAVSKQFTSNVLALRERL